MDEAENLEAVEVGKVNIEEDDINDVIVEEGECCAAVRDGAANVEVITCREQSHEPISEGWFVIDDEDPNPR